MGVGCGEWCEKWRGMSLREKRAFCRLKSGYDPQNPYHAWCRQVLPAKLRRQLEARERANESLTSASL